MRVNPNIYELSHKENIYPNKLLPTTGEQSPYPQLNYPKVSCFKTSNDENQTKDWRKRIINLSDREKALNNKLTRMMTKVSSPIKKEKMTIEIASRSNTSKRQMSNTLGRYLCQNSFRSILQMEPNINETIQALEKVTQDLGGSPLHINSLSNPEDALLGILCSLKLIRDSKTDKTCQQTQTSF